MADIIGRIGGTYKHPVVDEIPEELRPDEIVFVKDPLASGLWIGASENVFPGLDEGTPWPLKGYKEIIILLSTSGAEWALSPSTIFSSDDKDYNLSVVENSEENSLYCRFSALPSGYVTFPGTGTAATPLTTSLGVSIAGGPDVGFSQARAYSVAADAYVREPIRIQARKYPPSE